MKVKTHTRKYTFIPALIAVGILALIGGTIAYYADSQTYSNVFPTLDAEVAEYVEHFTPEEDWTPCAETPKTAIATNKTNANRYVRMKFVDYWRVKNSTTPETDHATTDLPLYWTDENGQHRYTIINLQNEDDWTLQSDGWYYYNTPIGKDESTTSLLKSVTFNCEANLVGEIRYSEDGKSGESIPNEYADAQYHVYVHFQMSNKPFEVNVPEGTVARIERTQKLYPSIMAAEAEAIANDTITLLVDTAEEVTNEKTVTLDLNEHTVTGTLTNTTSGNIRIINGEINNPDGPAVTNHGTLTIGINDYNDDGTANIIRDNVRLIGTTAGLLQTNDSYVFNFYDGYLEGDLGLVGGYNDTPTYRTTYDGTTIYYYPFVDHMEAGDRIYQHVELKTADKAVSKTTERGEVYYYNLQDNINTSAVTGYRIYAVRTFDASYPITIAENTDITFDIIGYTVNLGNFVTINGKFTVIDSKYNTAPGLLTSSKTIENNGEFIVQNATVSAITTNTLIENNNALKLRNATLKSDKGVVVDVPNNETTTLDMDATSKIVSESSEYALTNHSHNLELTNGTIEATQDECAVYNYNDATFTISGGTIKGTRYALCNERGTVNINGGLVKVEGATSGRINAIWDYVGTVNINGGHIVAENTANREIDAVMSNSSGGSLTITGGHIEAIKTGSGDTLAIFNFRSATIDGENILIESKNLSDSRGYTTAAINSDNTVIGNATISVETYNSPTYALSGSKTYTINEGAVITAHSTEHNAYAIGPRGGRYSNTVIMNGGTLSAITDAEDKEGIGIDVNYATITGGSVYGNTYGITANEETILGTNEDPLYNGINTDDEGHIYVAKPIIKGGVYGIKGGPVSFYDGIIKGGATYIDSVDNITAVPDGTSRNIVDLTDPEIEQDCWLEYDEDYLQLPDGTTYHSLTAAYTNAEAGDTITVIRDATTQAVLPENAQEITIDLNGHTLNYSQPLINNSTMTIVDSSQAKTGTIINTNTGVLENHGTLVINSGTISGYNDTVQNYRNSTLTINGGTIKSTVRAVYNEVGHTAINGGEILVGEGENTTSNTTSGIYNYNGTIEINGGHIKVDTANSYLHGVTSYSWGEIEITGGHIEVISRDRGDAYGVDSFNMTTITGADTLIEVIDTHDGLDNYTVSAIASGNTTIEDATVRVTTDGTPAYALTGNQRFTIKGNATISAHSEQNNAYGAGPSGCYWHTYYNQVDMESGTITGTTNAEDKIGIGVGVCYTTITGGEVRGSTYGILAGDDSDSYVTLGTNEDPLYNGINTDDEGHIYATKPIIKGGVYGISGTPVNFYDGIIKGGTAYIDSADHVKAIPDGASRVVTDLTNPKVEQDCWLEYDEDYLQLPDGTTYHSLTAAYDHAENGETITVIRDASTQAVLPTNTKTVTIDLNGHLLNYTQPIPNEGNLTITDSSQGKTGTINNEETVVIENHGTLTLNGGTINGTYNIVENNNGASVTMNGGSIKGIDAGINNDRSTVTLNGGEIITTSVRHNNHGIYSNRGDVIIHNTHIKATVAEDGKCWGVEVSGGSLVITGGHIEAINHGYGEVNGVWAGNGAPATPVSGSSTLIEATNDSTNAKSDVTAFNGSINLTNATIRAENNLGEATGLDSGYATVQSGTVTAHSVNNNAYGIAGGSYRYSTTLDMSGGSVSGTTDASDKIGAGVSVIYATITGGTVYGNTYGIAADRDGDTHVTLGINELPVYNGINTDEDGHVYAAKPVIRGGVYGIKRGIVSFYDGIIKGGTNAYYDRNIKEIADNTYIHSGTETIGGVVYETRYLSEEIVMARIGSTDYKSIKSAVNAANTGDEIDLVTDNYVYYNLEIPANKKVTIDLNGYTIITGNPIVNKGETTIYDSASETQLLDYREADVFITNENNGKLTLNGLKIKSRFPLRNNQGGTLTLNNVEIGDQTVVETAVENYGILNVDGANIQSSYRGIYTIDNTTTTIANSDIKSTRYALYNGNSSITISHTNLDSYTTEHTDYYAYLQQGDSPSVIANNINFHGRAYIEQGTATIEDSNIALEATESRMPAFINKANTIINNVIINDRHVSYNGWDDGIRSITNTGTLTADRVTINHAVNEGTYNSEASKAIYNTGTLSITDSNINLTNESANNTYTSRASMGIWNTGTIDYINTNITISQEARNSYGIYAESGSVNMKSGAITLAAANNAFGLWINEGTIAMGEAESNSSPNYGTANADVSTTIPSVTAIGGEGYGIGVTLGAGSFNYYDGKIIQSSITSPAVQTDHTTAATITDVEYLYQPERYMDSNNHTYFILEYMR